MLQHLFIDMISLLLQNGFSLKWSRMIRYVDIQVYHQVTKMVKSIRIRDHTCIYYKAALSIIKLNRKQTATTNTRRWITHLKYVLHIFFRKLVLSKKQFYSCPHLGISENQWDQNKKRMMGFALKSNSGTSKQSKENRSLLTRSARCVPE